MKIANNYMMTVSIWHSLPILSKGLSDRKSKIVKVLLIVKFELSLFARLFYAITCYWAPDATLDVFTGSAAHLFDRALVAVDPHHTVWSVRGTQFRVLIAPTAICKGTVEF